MHQRKILDLVLRLLHLNPFIKRSPESCMDRRNDYNNQKPLGTLSQIDQIDSFFMS